MKGRKRMGSAGFGVFEKMKCIFSIVPVGNLEKSREDAGPEGLDAVPARPVCCLLLGC